MKRKSRVLFAVLLIGILAVMSACGGKKEAEPKTESAVTETPTPTPTAAPTETQAPTETPAPTEAPAEEKPEAETATSTSETEDADAETEKPESGQPAGQSRVRMEENLSGGRR